jgi:hypothetical protein
MPTRKAVETISEALELPEDERGLLLQAAGFLPAMAPNFIRWPVLRDLGELLDKEWDPASAPGSLETLLLGIAEFAKRSALPEDSGTLTRAMGAKIISGANDSV